MTIRETIIASLKTGGFSTGITIASIAVGVKI